MLADPHCGEDLPLNASRYKAGCPTALLALVWCCAPAYGQARQQFPSAVPNVGVTPAPSLNTTPGAFPNAAGAVPIRQPGFDPYDTRGGTLMPPGGYIGSNLGAQPGYAQPQPYGAQPYAAQPYAAQPYGAQPYAAPPGYGAQPYGGFTAPYGGGPYGGSPYYDGYMIPRPRRLQHVSFDWTWLPGDPGSEPADFDINDFNLRASFAFPFFYSQQPLVITPAFGLHLWNGPATTVSVPNQVYDFTLDFAWKPQFGDLFALDLGVTPGFFTDSNGINGDAFRIQGRVVGIVTVSPRLQVVLGIVYLDRLDVKLLPVVGAVWTPNEDARFELVFPRPKLAQRLTNVGNTEWWWYVAGEYGGNEWAMNEPVETTVDYRDLRIILGLEWRNYQGPQGMFELGYVFNRKLQFHDTLPSLELNDTVMLRAGVTF